MQTTQSLFKHPSIVDPKIVLRRFEDKKGNRFYYSVDEKTQDIIIYAGITSVISQSLPESPFLTQWKINQGKEWKKELNTAAEYGTMMHVLFAEFFQKNGPGIEQCLSNMDLFCSEHGLNVDMPRKDLLAFIKWVEDYEVEPLLIETMLISSPVNGAHCAMTIDNLSRITIQDKSKQMVQDGEYKIGPNKGQPKMVEKTVVTPRRALALIDFKSNMYEKESKSFYEGHKQQLIAAREAVAYNFDIKENIVIANLSPLSWRNEPGYEFKIHDIKDDDVAIFHKYMEIAALRGLFSPEGRIFIAERFDTSKEYMFLTYKQYIEYTMSKVQNKKL